MKTSSKNKKVPIQTQKILIFRILSVLVAILVLILGIKGFSLSSFLVWAEEKDLEPLLEPFGQEEKAQKSPLMALPWYLRICFYFSMIQGFYLLVELFLEYCVRG